MLLAGAPKTVEFDFDLAADTAYSVANEMVSDLSLSHEDAKVRQRAIPSLYESIDLSIILRCFPLAIQEWES